MVITAILIILCLYTFLPFWWAVGIVVGTILFSHILGEKKRQKSSQKQPPYKTPSYRSTNPSYSPKNNTATSTTSVSTPQQKRSQVQEQHPSAQVRTHPKKVVDSFGISVIAVDGGGRKIEIKLKKTAIASGGEGSVFLTDKTGFVAKIYKPEKLDQMKYEKLKLMLSKHIDYEGICFPLALLYNKDNKFVGYLMKEARGTELQKCVFIPVLLQKTFPDWKKKDTIKLCITILKNIQYLHEHGVILGDINPNNILVISPEEVYFVDTDSYQIDKYPCPVGTINFTAPEIQRKKFDSFLRTLGNEYFAVATLLFMIMLPGKPPYSMQGGGNQIDNIINGEFPYSNGQRAPTVPKGKWRYCWSHLPRNTWVDPEGKIRLDLKKDFYETFRKGERHSTESTRYSTQEWLQKFEYYLQAYDNIIEWDSMSGELFPTRIKRPPVKRY